MHLINEKYTWHDFCSTFFSPLGYLLVDLFSYFCLYFSDVSSKQGLEALGPAVDNIDLVKSDSVHNFFSLLELSLWALDEPGLGSDVIVVTASRE